MAARCEPHGAPGLGAPQGPPIPTAGCGSPSIAHRAILRMAVPSTAPSQPGSGGWLQLIPRASPSACSPCTPTPMTRRPRAPPPRPDTTAEGVRTVLVCCTGGEEGELHNPSLREPGQPFHGLSPTTRRPAGRAPAPELAGPAHHRLRRGRDARVPGLRHQRQPRQRRPGQLPSGRFREAVGRLVEVIRRTRPQVIITYNDDQQGYPHPDHSRSTTSRCRPSNGPVTRLVPRAGEPGSPASCTTRCGVAAGCWPSTRRCCSCGERRPSTRPGSSVRTRTVASRRRSRSVTTCGRGPARSGRTPPRSTRARRSGSGSRTRS